MGGYAEKNHDKSLNETVQGNSRASASEGMGKDILNYRNFFESMINNDRVCFAIVQGTPARIVSVNRGFALLMDSSVEELTSMTQDQLESMVLPEYRKDFISRYYSRLEGKHEENSYQIMVQTVRGRVKCLQLYVSSVEFGGKNSVFVLVIDVTEITRAEDALREREEYYRLLFNMSPAGIFYYDLDLVITDFNDRFTEILNSTREKLSGLDMHFLNDQRVLPCIGKAIQGGEGFYEGAYSATTGDAEIIITLKTEPLMNETGAVRGGAGIVEDMTGRRKAEEALVKSEQRFRDMVYKSPLPLAVVNDDDRLIYVNPSFTLLFGYEKEEIGGLGSWWPMAYPDESYRKKVLEVWNTEYARARESGEARGPGEFRVTCRDGEQRNIEFHLMPVDGLVFIMMNDLTEHRIAEAELVRARKIESLGVLAGGIAHDFNNILTAVAGNLSLAKEFIDDRDQLLEILSIVEKASLRGKDLTQQLLTFSKGGAPVRKNTSVEGLLRGTVDFVLSGSNVRCDYMIAPDLKDALIDEGQISQVIHNLALNAMQAMPSGGVMEVGAGNFEAHEDNQNLQAGDYVRITFRDRGEGIDEEILADIFDPFFTTKNSGSGLGLSVTYSIVKKHGGFIQVNSRKGEGALFEVYLPVSEGGGSSPDKALCEPVVHGGRVLVMDDEKLILETSRRMLEKMKFRVDTAVSGEEAVEKFSSAINEGSPFDLVILDLTVPGSMGGREVISVIKEQDPHVRSIVSSGYSNDPVLSSYSDYGFNGVAVKPYTFADLLNEVNRVLAGE